MATSAVEGGITIDTITDAITDRLEHMDALKRIYHNRDYNDTEFRQRMKYVEEYLVKNELIPTAPIKKFWYTTVYIPDGCICCGVVPFAAITDEPTYDPHSGNHPNCECRKENHTLKELETVIPSEWCRWTGKYNSISPFNVWFTVSKYPTLKIIHDYMDVFGGDECEFLFLLLHGYRLP